MGVIKKSTGGGGLGKRTVIVLLVRLDGIFERVCEVSLEVSWDIDRKRGRGKDSVRGGFACDEVHGVFFT